jgi:hypothetical protein
MDIGYRRGAEMIVLGWITMGMGVLYLVASACVASFLAGRKTAQNEIARQAARTVGQCRTMAAAFRPEPGADSVVVPIAIARNVGMLLEMAGQVIIVQQDKGKK